MVAAGAPIGSSVISARLDGPAAFLDFHQKAAASPDYLEAGKKMGPLLAAPTETNLVQVIATAGEPGPPKPLTMVTSVTIANNTTGGLSAARAWSNRVLEHVLGDRRFCPTGELGHRHDVRSKWVGSRALTMVTSSTK